MTIGMGDLALLILFVLCLAIFVYLLIKVLKGRAIRIDEVGYLLLVERLRSPVLTAAMKAASSLASLPFVVGVLAAAMLWAPIGPMLSGPPSMSVLSAQSTSC